MPPRDVPAAQSSSLHSQPQTIHSWHGRNPARLPQEGRASELGAAGFLPWLPQLPSFVTLWEEEPTR